MSRRRRRFQETINDINLIPIMGLMVVLIPMLLLITVFVQIGVINVSAPKTVLGPPSDAPDEENKPLNLTIGISEKGFTLAATGGVLPGQEIDPDNPEASQQQGPQIPTQVVGRCGPSIAAQDDDERCFEGTICPHQCGNGNLCKDGQCLKWDYMALYNRMIEIKDKYPEERIVNLGADDAIGYGTLITTMDTIRLRRSADRFSNAELFEDAEFKFDSDGAPEMLFGDVILAVIQ